MSAKAKRALKKAIRLLLDHGHPAKWIAHQLEVDKDFVYRKAPEFFATLRRKRATVA